MKLEITTPTDREIVMTRTFDAPRKLVFEAYTKPELLKRWLGVFNGWTLDVCEVDLRVGGGFRFEWRHPGKTGFGLVNSITELIVPERIVATERFEGDPNEAISTLTFTETAGRTTLTNTIVYANQKIRDAVLKSGMSNGVAASYDQLDQILAAQ